MAATTAFDATLQTTKTAQNQALAGSNVLAAIKQAASRTGVDFAYLVNKADQESGMNPAAKAKGSSATGLYQFINSTWLNMVKAHGATYGLQQEADAITLNGGQATVKDAAMRQKILNLRNDPVLSSAMAAEFTKENKDYLDANVGGMIGSTELYMAHFLGAGGASKFITAARATPHATGAALFPDAASANKGVFYGKDGKALSLGAIYDRFAAKFNDEKAATRIAGLGAANGADMAQLSSSFYSLPNATTATPNFSVPATGTTATTALQAQASTADTLFNVLLLAQTHMNRMLRDEDSNGIVDGALRSASHG